MGRLDGMVALVTGAASGIGEACVRRFTDEGAVVVGLDVNPAAADVDGAVDVAVAAVDVRDEEAVARAIGDTIAANGHLDIVVNAAGVAGGGPVHQLSADEWDRVLDVNLTGTYLVCKHALVAMVGQRSGNIVNIASIEGIEGTEGGSAYNASKGGVVLLTKNMAIDYGPSGIRSNAICPGFIETEMTGGKGSGANFPQMMEATPLKRAGQPEEVAELACFLASDRASYISGAIIPADGGMAVKLP